MRLPVSPPVLPMLAKATEAIPIGDYLYEPKWDGFRCLIFRDGDEVEMGSRNTKSLARYFPEVVAAARSELPERCVLDGELVVAGPDGLDFDMLSQRIHPAASRINLLAQETPARFVAFDLLALGDDDLRDTPFASRRRRLEAALEHSQPPIHLTPITDDPDRAQDWFERFEGAGLDGVVAKSRGLQYVSDKRAMAKIKHERTGDFVVGGFRWYQADRTVVGSLMLGLYDAASHSAPEDRLSHSAPEDRLSHSAPEDRLSHSAPEDGLSHSAPDRGPILHPVGVIGAFPAERRRAMVEELAPLRENAERDHPWAQWADFMVADGGTAPGGGNRWNAKKDMSFELLRPELVVEAAFEHLQGRRLRHNAQFRRWRRDRDPRSCTYDQLDVAVPALLADVFAPGRG